MFENFSAEHDKDVVAAACRAHEALWLFERQLQREMVAYDSVGAVVLAVSALASLLEAKLPLRKETQHLMWGEIAPLAVKTAGRLQLRDEEKAVLEPGLVMRITELATMCFNAQWWSTSETGMVYPGMVEAGV